MKLLVIHNVAVSFTYNSESVKIDSTAWLLALVSERMDDHAPRVKEVAKELSAIRARGLANLDSTVNQPVLTPRLEEIASCVQPEHVTAARSVRIARLLQAGIAELEFAKHKRVLQILFGLSDEFDKETPNELRRMAAKHLDISFDNFKRRDGQEGRILESFASVLWHQATAIEQALNRESPDTAPTTAIATEPDLDDMPQPTAPHRGKRRSIVIGGVVLVVLLIGGGAILAVTHDSSPSAQQQAGSAPPGLPSGSTGQRFAEQQGNLGTETYSNSLGGAADGPPVGPLQRVEVSCKVYAVPFPSALPDGYFYRLEGAPWFGRYYAVANSFLNGDPIPSDGRAPTNTDPAVPDCPAD